MDGPGLVEGGIIQCLLLLVDSCIYEGLELAVVYLETSLVCMYVRSLPSIHRKSFDSAPPQSAHSSRPVRTSSQRIERGIRLGTRCLTQVHISNHLRHCSVFLHTPRTNSTLPTTPTPTDLPPQPWRTQHLPQTPQRRRRTQATPIRTHAHTVLTISPPRSLSVFTPVNAVLLSLFLYLVYTRLRPSAAPTLAASAPMVFKTFTPSTLRPFNGVDDPRVMLGVQGKVFDVTAGKSFYGPGGPYSNFAGRDASRGLAKNSFDEDMLTDVDMPLDLLVDLTDEERGSLKEWAAHFEGKYLLVGRLVNEGEE